MAETPLSERSPPAPGLPPLSGSDAGSQALTTIASERVLAVQHWTETQFTFLTTRDAGLRFSNGQFVMLGLALGDGPLMRAYSIASANYDDQLEFLSIKVPHGPLTSCLQHLRHGDRVLISRKPTGTLLISDLNPAERLFMLATGTGVAPFLSLIRDPELYERFASVILVHGVRFLRESAVVRKRIEQVMAHEVLGQEARARLRYFPAVTREPHVCGGRITTLIESQRLFRALQIPPLDARTDRAMLCGSPAMLADTRALLDARGFRLSPHVGEPGDYVIERAFVSK